MDYCENLKLNMNKLESLVKDFLNMDLTGEFKLDDVEFPADIMELESNDTLLLMDLNDIPPFPLDINDIPPFPLGVDDIPLPHL